MMKHKLIILFVLLLPAYAIGQQGHLVVGNKLVWDSSAGALGYVVHYGQNPSILTHKLDVGNVTEYVITNLPYVDPDYPWYFSVSAYIFNDESDLCPAVRWSGLSRPAKLYWSQSASTDVVLYKVYMQESSGQYTEPFWTGSETYCETPVLLGGETYRFKIEAIDAAGLVSTATEIEKTIEGLPSIKQVDTEAPLPTGNLILIVE